MSFILDALKKSEDERLRQAGPSLADAPIHRRRAERPWWAIAVAALLIVNMIVLGIVLARGKSAPAAPAPSPTVAAAPAAYAPPGTQSAAQQAPITMTPTPAPVVQSARAALETQPTDNAAYVQPIQGPAVAPSATQPQMNAASMTTPLNTPALAQPQQNYNQPQSYNAQSYNPPSQQPTAAAQAPPPASASASTAAQFPPNLPSANEAMASGAISTALHLDLHVYAQNANGRFVFINGRKYLEGQTTAEGPVVEQITADGVILSNRGQRFVLPRQ